MKKDLIKYLKLYVIHVLIMTGMFYWLKIIWDKLECLFDGGVQESISDSIIAVILIYVLWKEIIKWIDVKSTESIKEKIKKLP